MFERYTEGARRTIFFARYEAHQLGAEAINTEHVLLGLMREDPELFSRFVPGTQAADEVRRRVEAAAAPPPPGVSVKAELPLHQDCKRTLAYAHEESQRLSHQHIGNEHLLLGLLRGEGTLAETLLAERGVALDAARGEVALLRPAELRMPRRAGQAADPWEEASYEFTRREGADGMRVEHIGIATPRIEDALRFWRDALGLAVTHTEVVEEQGVRVAMLPVGEPRVELLEPTGPESPVAKFLEKRGPGIHHMAVRVPDIRAALARLRESGARLIDETPRRGADNCLVAFVHPASAGGVLLELVEHDAGGPHAHETGGRFRPLRETERQ